MVKDFTQQTKDLIDNLKGICASYGLGNDGNESKIITQVFLYKFMNDKFGYELKILDKRFSSKDSWEMIAADLPDDVFNKLILKLSPNIAKLKKEHFLSSLYNKQNSKNFSKLFDATLIDISQSNASIFSVSTAGNSKIVLFDELSQFISDPSTRDDFCRAIVNQLINFSFEDIFVQKFDFFSTIFEYLIKDYNKDGGGKYAEYYTPHTVSKIMAKILVDSPKKNVTVCDPSAGSGTLLMNVAHEIGETNCTIYSQDISQKSSGMLRLNLILNGLVHSIQNVVQGNTLRTPAHRDGKDLRKFDFIVSNPPFKLDFSDYRDELDSKINGARFFAGIPNVSKKPETMPIYLLFIQHIIYSLNQTGSAAIVVPTGFLTGSSGIIGKLHKKLIDEKILKGVITMPSNIFATTGTNVSVLILKKGNQNSGAILIDASNLGTIVKEGKNQKTVLSTAEEDLIIDTFKNRQTVEDFSILVDFEDIKKKNYSFAAGQHFNVRIERSSLTSDEFQTYLNQNIDDLNELFSRNRKAEVELSRQLKLIKYESTN